MTSIMWPTRSRVSHSVQRVCTFQFFGSETMRVKFSRSRRMTFRTVALPSADIGLTGAISVVVLMCSFPLQSLPNDHVLSVSGARRRRGRYDDGRKRYIQLVAANLEPGRQAQGRSKGLDTLVDCEAWTIGRDLEEHPARLTKVDRLEVIAVDDGRHVEPAFDERFAPLGLVG